jgi:hypothetical protein
MLGIPAAGAAAAACSWLKAVGYCSKQQERETKIEDGEYASPRSNERRNNNGDSAEGTVKQQPEGKRKISAYQVGHDR